MTDVFKRRQAMINLAAGRGTQEDADALTGSSEDSYGEVEQISKDEARGRYEAIYKGETRQYFVPSDGAWISGRRITMEKAYLVVGEDDNIVQVRRVQNPSELESVKLAMIERVRKILRK
ncbi:MAG: hypothetical protein ABH840_00080 [Nanoarchaeota archaeon]